MDFKIAGECHTSSSTKVDGKSTESGCVGSMSSGGEGEIKVSIIERCA